ncbi:B3 domain-containing protein At4g01580-like [Olea europaea var. sylvestris]|uniref:B3 domain-containing protein At4g01580-like n=1 Tax=Olea europaea var. sylvestris TaxID=158386 RepID=UPI000C1D28C7|nr:B3 domain-containing protein At4g01580-like [Olea europaea var. sylvestris]
MGKGTNLLCFSILSLNQLLFISPCNLFLCNLLSNLQKERSFVNHPGHQLTDTVRLIGYETIIANIRLERVDEKIYLAGGWEHFFYHHNLQDGYLLVFEYNENSTFNVMVLDHSGQEVIYNFDILEKDTLLIGNLVFEVTLAANHNDHRKIVSIYLEGKY